MQKITLIENFLEPSIVKTFEVENVCEFLVKYFPQWPSTAKIYNGSVADENDVTPSNEEEIEQLQKLVDVTVIIFPAVAVAGLFFVATKALTPKVPTPAVPRLSNNQTVSPNNQLGQRENTPRQNSRIPDIFGKVRSTPDLISVPYRVYDNHQEVEICYMSVGRGTYFVEDVKDDDTLVSEISGTTVAVYAPYTSPNSGDAPQLLIGSEISDPLLKAKQLNSVNGQVVRAPNSNSVRGVSNIRFVYPNTIEINSGTGTVDFADFFATDDILTITAATYSGSIASFSYTQSLNFTLAGEIVFATGDPTQDFRVGDTITLSDAARTDGFTPVDLAGVYIILSINSTTITLDDPASVNSDWSLLSSWAGDETGFDDSDIELTSGSRSLDFSGTYTVLSVSTTQIDLSSPEAVNDDWYALDELASSMTSYGSPTLETSGNKWIGPFVIDTTDLSQVFANFVSANGLYKDSGTQQTKFDVTVEVELTPVDSAGDPIGSAETFQGTIVGSAKVKTTRAVTIRADPTFTGRCQVRARRVTNADLLFSGTIVDEVRWQSCYGISPVAENDFGNVTTVHTQTYATTGALAIKSRKLNMLATRKIPLRVSGSTFSGTLTATKSAAEIFSFICLDPHIGNRSVDEIDFDSIYDSVDEVIEYFGDEKAGEFSYTFDSDNLSFEEIATIVANNVFCTAYRQGSVIRFNFEKATEDSTLIFNHRNKLPGSEKRGISFGALEQYDGVELDYADPDDDAVVTYYIPADRSALNAKKVDGVGIRTHEQAFWRSWRVWNRIRYQNVVVEFDSTQEAALCILNDRILVADNTRPNTQDGEILSQVGLVLTTSQPVTFEEGKTYSIFLQHTNGSVESIGITAGDTEREVVLDTTPSSSIVTDVEMYARCTYIVTANDDTRIKAFLLSEKDPQSNTTYNLKLVNYSSLYYQQDQIQLWFPFDEPNYIDLAPYGYDGVAVGGAVTATDGTRGTVHVGAAATDYVSFSTFNPPTSYTKMAWVYKTSLATNGNILSSKNTTHEAFLINSSGNLAAGHNATFTQVAAAWPAANAWHHAAVTYDVDTTTMKLYIDGELADENNSVAQRTLADIIAFGKNLTDGLVGKADDLRLYKKALSDIEIKDIYRTTAI